MIWGVTVVSPDYPFQAELAIDADSDVDAQEKARELVGQLRIAQELGPMSWHYAALVPSTVRPISSR